MLHEREPPHIIKQLRKQRKQSEKQIEYENAREKRSSARQNDVRAYTTTHTPLGQRQRRDTKHAGFPLPNNLEKESKKERERKEEKGLEEKLAKRKTFGQTIA